MEFKPTFFSISGFLVPGVVLLASVAGLILTRFYGAVRAIVSCLPTLPTEGAAAVLFGTVVIAVLIAITFVLGAILSETFIFIGRRIIIRPFYRKRLRKNVGRLFAHTTIEELIKADMDAREVYVYMTTVASIFTGMLAALE